ncbi:MAG TPA: hypothetical protein VNJ04_01855 [Gemmatimonadaceae bacterium]|nr:hypothetical protein [Gemmatimonadaceae bacterium]
MSARNMVHGALCEAHRGERVAQDVANGRDAAGELKHLPFYIHIHGS